MLSEHQLDRYIKITIALIIIVILATFGLYFYFYKQPGLGKLSIVEQQIAELQKRVQKNPRDSAARLYLGQAYLKNKQYDLAVKELKEFLKIEKKNQLGYYMLGLAYKLKGKDTYSLAEKQFQEVVKLAEGKEFAKINTNLKSSYYFLGEIAFNRKQYKKALDNFKKSAGIGTNDADTYRYIGRSYFELKDYKNSEKYLNLAVKFVPNYGEVYYDLGQLFQAQGNKSKAKQNYSKALKYNPNLKEADQALESL